MLDKLLKLTKVFAISIPIVLHGGGYTSQSQPDGSECLAGFIMQLASDPLSLRLLRGNNPAQHLTPKRFSSLSFF
jgi:hypothetical protein